MFVPGKESKKMALKKVEQVCSIPFRSTLYPSYFHSFGMTENYIVFVEQPFKLDILKLATAYFRGINWGTCLKFDKDDIVSDRLSFSSFLAERAAGVRGPSVGVTTVFFSPDAVSRHRQKDGKDLVDSLLRGLPGGFSPHQCVRGGGPPGVRHDLLRGQQPVRLVLHPELQARLERLRAGQREELLPAHLQEVRLADGRQQGAFAVKKVKGKKDPAQCALRISGLSFLTLRLWSRVSGRS